MEGPMSGDDVTKNIAESPESSSSTISRSESTNQVLSPDGTLPIPVASSSPLPKPDPRPPQDIKTSTSIASVTTSVQEHKTVEGAFTCEEVTVKDNNMNATIAFVQNPNQVTISQNSSLINEKVSTALENIADEEDEISEVASDIGHNERNSTMTTNVSESSTSTRLTSGTYARPGGQELASNSIPSTQVQAHETPNISRNNSLLEEETAPAPRKQANIEDDDFDNTQVETQSAKRKLNFQSNSERSSSKRISSTKRAGLVLSVSRINRRIKAGRYARRTGFTAGVYMAAVLEYLVAEVLELAGNCARYFRKHRIFPRCIQLTLLHDKELFKLTKGAIVPQGGVKPFIHPALQPQLYSSSTTESGPSETLPSSWAN